MSTSEGKSPQVHARPGHTESQVDSSFLIASTCESVWPGLKQKNIKTVSSEDMLLMLMFMSQLSSLANKLLMLMLILTMFTCVAI